MTEVHLSHVRKYILPTIVYGDDAKSKTHMDRNVLSNYFAYGKTD